MFILCYKMPKTIINYSNTIIYKIVCKDQKIKDCYVGHTTNFTNRKRQHKSTCGNANDRDHNFHVYKFIRNNGGWDNWDMIMIEEYDCKNLLQAKQRERYWIENIKPTLNVQTPLKTTKEWRDTHKDHYKNYFEMNKDSIMERQREKRLEKKEYPKEINDLIKENYLLSKQIQSMIKEFEKNNT